MTVATELAALTERLSNHIRATEDAIVEDKAEKKIAGFERQEMLIQLKELRHDMNDVKPVISMVQSVQSKIAGAVIVLGFIGTVTLIGVTFLKDQIITAIWGP